MREWIATSALAAIVLGIVGWLLVDKFDLLKDQIAEVRKVAERLDQRLSDAEKANLTVNSFLHNELKDLVDRINNTNITVNTISGDVKAQSQKIDSLVSSVATLQSSITPLTALPELVRSIDARTARMEDLLRAPPHQEDNRACPDLKSNLRFEDLGGDGLSTSATTVPWGNLAKLVGSPRPRQIGCGGVSGRDRSDPSPVRLASGKQRPAENQPQTGLKARVPRTGRALHAIFFRLSRQTHSQWVGSVRRRWRIAGSPPPVSRSRNAHSVVPAREKMLACRADPYSPMICAALSKAVQDG